MDIVHMTVAVLRDAVLVFGDSVLFKDEGRLEEQRR